MSGSGDPKAPLIAVPSAAPMDVAGPTRTAGDTNHNHQADDGKIHVPTAAGYVPPPSDVASPREMAAAAGGGGGSAVPGGIQVPTASQIAYGAVPAPPAYGSEAAPSLLSMNQLRAKFGMFLLGGFVLSILLQFNAVQWILKWVVERQIDSNCAIGVSPDDRSQCMGAQGVYRVSFALFIFFFAHYLASHRQNLCMASEDKITFNQNYFLVKCILLIAVTLICFVIPNSFFVVWAWFAFVLSIFFLVAQILVLIEFAFAWSEDWNKKAEELGDSRYRTGLLVSSIVMIIGAIVIISLGFVWFGHSSECGGNQAALCLTLIAGIFSLALSLKVGRGTIVPAAVVFIYTAWTCFSALSGSSQGPCRGVDPGSTSQLVLSAVFTAASLILSTLSAATSRDAFECTDMELTGADADASLLQHFQGVCTLAAAYLSMLVTNWTIVGDNSMASIYGNKNNASLAAKLGSEGLCVVLFFITLIAPMCCKNRSYE